MNLDINKIQENLCQMLCAEIRLFEKNKNLIRVETPFFFPDGDPYQIYIKELPGGNMKLSDMGHTMMHLSYENDTSKFREGTRGNIFNQILAETSVKEENGEFSIDTNIDSLIMNLFRFGQAITKMNDLQFLNRARAESTFYEDLQENMFKIIPEDKIKKDYIYAEIENAQDYPIDYCIQGKTSPLFVFGIPNKDKARLTTIVLEHLLRAKADFDSLLIFADQTTMPRPDLARLSNTGGEMISSLDAVSDFSRKLLRKVELN
jgi:hypothetical protein